MSGVFEKRSPEEIEAARRKIFQVIGGCGELSNADAKVRGLNEIWAERENDQNKYRNYHWTIGELIGLYPEVLKERYDWRFKYKVHEQNEEIQKEIQVESSLLTCAIGSQKLQNVIDVLEKDPSLIQYQSSEDETFRQRDAQELDNRLTKGRASPLTQAIIFSRTSNQSLKLENDIIKYLIVKGADVNALDARGYPPLAYALSNYHSLEQGRADMYDMEKDLCHMLVDYGAKLDQPINNFQTKSSVVETCSLMTYFDLNYNPKASVSDKKLADFLLELADRSFRRGNSLNPTRQSDEATKNKNFKYLEKRLENLQTKHESEYQMIRYCKEKLRDVNIDADLTEGMVQLEIMDDENTKSVPSAPVAMEDIPEADAKKITFSERALSEDEVAVQIAGQFDQLSQAAQKQVLDFLLYKICDDNLGKDKATMLAQNHRGADLKMQFSVKDLLEMGANPNYAAKGDNVEVAGTTSFMRAVLRNCRGNLSYQLITLTNSQADWNQHNQLNESALTIAYSTSSKNVEAYLKAQNIDLESAKEQVEANAKAREKARIRAEASRGKWKFFSSGDKTKAAVNTVGSNSAVNSDNTNSLQEPNKSFTENVIGVFNYLTRTKRSKIAIEEESSESQKQPTSYLMRANKVGVLPKEFLQSEKQPEPSVLQANPLAEFVEINPSVEPDKPNPLFDLVGKNTLVESDKLNSSVEGSETSEPATDNRVYLFSYEKSDSSSDSSQESNYESDSSSDSPQKPATAMTTRKHQKPIGIKETNATTQLKPRYR